jgi:putative photosynthetic complex assembly protein 2
VLAPPTVDAYLWSLAATILLWWCGTAIVLTLVRAPVRLRPAAALLTTGLALAGLALLPDLGNRLDAAGALASFACGLAVWAWNEVAFLMGVIVGPPPRPCADPCRGLAHAGHALRAILYHELALVISAVLVVCLSWGLPNQVGMWGFLILLGMRVSAQLNLFLGVRNLSEEWLPRELQHLRPFLRKRSMNPLFPFSVILSAALTLVLASRLFQDVTSEFQAARDTILTVLAALGLLEHFLLVLPFDPTRLWLWSPPASRND